MNASIDCANKNVKEYSSEYGQTYVLIVADNLVDPNTKIRFTALCNVDTCHTGQYLDTATGTCMNCPQGFVSSAGSVSFDSCSSCLVDGFEPLGPKSKDCKVSSSANPAVNTFNSWRIIVPKEHTFANLLNILELEFYAADDCRLASKISLSGGEAFSSNPVMSDAAKAFNNDAIWRGIMDYRDLFYLGITLNRTVTVKCIIYKQQSLMVKELRVQAKNKGEENWKNVWISRNIPNFTTVIPFVVVSTKAPMFAPTITQTLEPIRTPNTLPISMPSMNAPISQTSEPIRTPNESPISASLTSAPMFTDRKSVV